MSRVLRRVLLTCAGLGLLALLLFYRLDSGAIRDEIARQLTRLPGTTLQMEDVRPSLLHGPGLRLEHARLSTPVASVDSAHLDLGLRLLPLLLGKIELADIAIHDGIIRLSGATEDGGSPGAFDPGIIARLPTERLQLVRCALRSGDQAILDDVYLDVRGIGQNREMLWEIQAQKRDQGLRGHGRIDFRRGEAASGFGKLKFNRVSARALAPWLPERMNRALELPARQISGTLTMDMRTGKSWSLFGELSLQADQREPIRLRGKLSHEPDGRTLWRDSFIHFSHAAAIALEGECGRDGCASSITGRAVPLAIMIALLRGAPLPDWSGQGDFSARLNWHEGVWSASADLDLTHLVFHGREDMALPDLRLAHARIEGRGKAWRLKSHDSQDARQMAAPLRIELFHDGEEDGARLRVQAPASFWKPWLDVALQEHGLDATYQASGKLDLALDFRRHARASELRFRLDATESGLKHPRLNKPASVPLNCAGRLRWQGDDPLAVSAEPELSLDHCRLSESRVRKLEWHRKAAHRRFSLREIELDFDEAAGFLATLPAPFTGFHGKLSGDSISTSWDGDRNTPWPWMKRAGGQLLMQQLGTADWKASGSITAKNGLLGSRHLHLEGAHGHAELSGRFDFAHMKGRLDILSGFANLDRLPPLDPAWNRLQLEGSLSQVDARLLDNDWKALAASYAWRDGGLALSNGEAGLGGGRASFRRMRLFRGTDGIGLDGDLRLHGVQLEQLRGMDTLLKARLGGTLHANVRIRGEIGQSLAGWRTSNGDLLIYNGRYQRETDSSPRAFRRLEGRFRIGREAVNVKNIRLVHRGHDYRGWASIDASGRITGLIQDSAGRFSLRGQWPHLDWNPLPASAAKR